MGIPTKRRQAQYSFPGFEIIFGSGARRGDSAREDGNTNSGRGSQGSKIYHDTPIDFGRRDIPEEAHVPERIREMMALYSYGPDPYIDKRRNFYEQGMLMEDYVDDAPWEGRFRRYYATYHDLNVPQLRGYFTWRTQARQGNWQKTPTSFAYIYIYELLNGIGAADPMDSLAKLREFEKGFLDSGLGDARMRPNLHRWMTDFCIVNGLPEDQALPYMDQAMLERDSAVTVLSRPQDHSAEEVYEALALMGGKNHAVSPVVKKYGPTGLRLFALAWEQALRAWSISGRDLFFAIFGKKVTVRWYPLSNAVYWKRKAHEDTVYELGPARRYICSGGSWKVERYEELYFDRERMRSFYRGVDRLLRRHLKTGYYLTPKDDEQWVEPYVHEAILRLKQERLEQSRQKVDIDLSHLGRIRDDAEFTKKSLLVDEAEFPGSEASDSEDAAGFISEVHDGAASVTTPRDDVGVQQKEPMAVGETEDPVPTGDACLLSDPMHIEIMARLLNDEPCGDVIKRNHMMPSVVADSINEALFDEIGDSVIELDGDDLLLVEDYREDVKAIFDQERFGRKSDDR